MITYITIIPLTKNLKKCNFCFNISTYAQLFEEDNFAFIGLNYSVCDSCLYRIDNPQDYISMNRKYFFKKIFLRKNNVTIYRNASHILQNALEEDYTKFIKSCSLTTL